MNFIHYILFSLLPTPISSRFLIFLILFTLSKRYKILSHKENRGANGWHVSLLVLPTTKIFLLCAHHSFSPMKMQVVALFLFKITFPLPPKWLFFMLFPPNYPIFFTPFIKFVHFFPPEDLRYQIYPILNSIYLQTLDYVVWLSETNKAGGEC